MQRALIILAVIFAACGGTAVVDGKSGPVTCACDADTDCPAATACGSFACDACACVPVDLATRGSDCDDGYCDGEGACVSREQICKRACEVIPVCLTSTAQECFDFCFKDLIECSAQQMADTDACTTELVAPECDGDAWLACIIPISCLESGI